MAECFVLGPPDPFVFDCYAVEGLFGDKMFYFSGGNNIEVPICNLCKYLEFVCIKDLGDGPFWDGGPVILGGN